MSKAEWGRATWYLLHTLPLKLKKTESSHIPTLWEKLSKICSVLPCPDCSSHAKGYIKYNAPKMKGDIGSLNMFFLNMHNWVNRRLKKPEVSAEQCVQKFSRANTNAVVRYFLQILSKNARHDKAMLESFNRQRIMKEFANYFNKNAHRFNA
tara:strand:+ start:29 stop:484 length:456 start_codon:yes stop_codon:yes gene_type:complete